MKTTILTTLCSLLFTVAALAQPVPTTVPRTNATITLEWDASPSPNITGYIVRRGHTRNTYVEEVRLGTVLTYTWANAPLGVTNFFSVAAVNSAGVQSDPSNIVFYDTPARPVPPNLKTAVPVTVSILSRGKDGLVVERLKLGPYLVQTEPGFEGFDAKMHIGPPQQILPKP